MTALDGGSAPTLDIGSFWPDLREKILTNAERALPLLRNLSAGDPTTSSAHRVDVLTLLAETYHLLRRHTAALDTATYAVDAAGDLFAVDNTRLLPATAVFADVTVSIRHPDAIAVCDEYLITVGEHPAPAPERRYHAQALRAVAVYHHDDRTRGRDMLQQLHDGTTGSQFKAMCAAGLTAMDNPAGPQAPGPMCPVFGGALHRAVHDPPVDYLATRIRAGST